MMGKARPWEDLRTEGSRPRSQNQRLALILGKRPFKQVEM